MISLQYRHDYDQWHALANDVRQERLASVTLIASALRTLSPGASNEAINSHLQAIGLSLTCDCEDVPLPMPRRDQLRAATARLVQNHGDADGHFERAMVEYLANAEKFDWLHDDEVEFSRLTLEKITSAMMEVRHG